MLLGQNQWQLCPYGIDLGLLSALTADWVCCTICQCLGSGRGLRQHTLHTKEEQWVLSHVLPKSPKSLDFFCEVSENFLAIETTLLSWQHCSLILTYNKYL